MRLALVGVGDAGGKIVDQIRAREVATNRNFCDGNVLLFGTAERDYSLKHIPRDHHVVIGDTHRAVSGEGVEGDADLAAQVTKEEAHDIRRLLDFVSVHELDGFLVVAGLGGGTGSGMGTIMVEELQALYGVPVYVLGVLPDESEGRRPAHNAARGLRSIVPKADNTLLFDNDAWYTGTDDLDVEYERINEEIATRVISLLGANELTGETVAEAAIDSSDIMRTLDTGGVSSMGYASVDLDDGDGLIAWLLNLFGLGGDDDAVIDPTVIEGIVQQAVNARLSVPCNVASAERALIVLSGPSSKLSRRGFESARYWLEEESRSVEVRAGDEPDEKTSELTASVVLSNVTDVPRIDVLQEQAVAYQREISERERIDR